MLKLKKIISVIAILGIAAGSLGGCGEKKTADGAYQLDWYYVGNVQPDVKLVEEEVNKYVADEMNISLNMCPLDWGGIKEKINVMVAGGEKFDIFYTSITNYNALVGKNALAPLGDLLEKYGSGIKSEIDQKFLDAVKVDGEIYAIPVNKEMAHNYGFMYQKDIAEKHGLTEQLDAMTKFEDIYPILDIIKEKEPDLYPLRNPVGCNDTDLLFETAVFPAGFYEGSNDGKVVNYIDTPEYLAAVKEIHSKYKKGYLPEGGSVNQSDEKFFSIMYPLKPGKDVEMSNTINWKQVDITKPSTISSDTMGAMMSISRTSENPEVAMKFINRAYSDPKLVNLLTYGIEGKHYEMDGENRIKRIENSGYDNTTYRWEFFNCFNQYLIENDDEMKNENLKEYNKATVFSSYIGFNPNTDNIKTQVGACANVKAEFDQQIADGIADPDELVAKYREKLKLAGADDIVADIQRQYDEWAAKQ